MRKYWHHLRYNIGNVILMIGQNFLPPGNVKRELQQILSSWRDMSTSRRFRDLLRNCQRKEMAKLIHEIARARLDGLISEYEARFLESARKFTPASYESLLAHVGTDFYYSGYLLKDDEIKIILKNLLDRGVLTYTVDWMIVEPIDINFKELTRGEKYDISQHT